MKTVIAFVVLLIVGFVAWRRQADSGAVKKSVTPAITKKPMVNPYNAVGIIPGKNACDVANELRGKRLLSKEAGSFPLEGCDKTECSCKFVHHEDRREEDDRREPVRGFVETQLEEDKRSRGDRRS